MSFSGDWMDPSMESTVALVAIVSSTLIMMYYSYHACFRSNNSIITSSYNNIPIKVVSTAVSLASVIAELLSYNPLYVGVDCEWRPNTKGQKIQNKVAILQIAHENLIILIRLNKLKNVQKAFLNSGLMSILSNNQIFKCGVGIFQDRNKLFKDYKINIQSCIELNNLYAKYNSDISFFSLKNLCKDVLKFDMIHKDKSITLSDWQTDMDLTPNQIIYAAEDAIIAYQIFHQLLKQNNITKTHINYDTVYDCLFGIIDKSKSFSKPVKSKATPNNPKKQKDSYEKHKEKTSVLYENCKILKPNGEFLSWCRRKTLQRYIRKDYAEKVDDTTIRLKFEPDKFDRKPRIDVVLGFKKNECSVCGESEKQLQRYYVVPLLYRQYLSDRFNEEAWRRHDMLPLCSNCHQQTQIYNEIFRNELCKTYNVIHYRDFDKHLVEELKLMKYIKPLIDVKVKLKVPRQKKIVLLKNILNYYKLNYRLVDDNDEKQKHSDLFEDMVLIENKNGDNDTNGNKEFVDKLKCVYNNYLQNKINLGKNASDIHSKAMVKKFENDELQFIKLWRKQFLDTSKPKYLPDYWDINKTFFNIKKK